MAYDFSTQLYRGADSERTLDRYFGRWYVVEPVSMELQRLGIDRKFTAPNGVVWMVEYKADETAARTGNAFIETVSVDRAAKMGWAYTSAAQMLVYFVPPTQAVYVLSVERIKTWLLPRLAEYPEKAIPNRGRGQPYNTIGVCVPLADLDDLAVCRRQLVA